VARISPAVAHSVESEDTPELFLSIWRALWTLSEQSAHCPNRIAQLFHREMLLGKKSPLFLLCLVPTTPLHTLTVDEGLFTSFVDGLQNIEAGVINFDDMDECAAAVKRIPFPSKDPPVPEGAVKVQILQDDEKVHAESSSVVSKDAKGVQDAPPVPWKKTFREPEGVSAFIVSIRNYFSLIHYNAFVALFAWFWSQPNDTSLVNFIWLDAALSGASVLFDFVARLLVYGFAIQCCGFCRLSKRQGIPLIFIYPLYLAYLPVVYLFHDLLQPCAHPLRL
jgi:hypothetical protein